MDDVHLFFQVLGPGNGPVRDPGSHDDQKIAGGYGPVGIGLSVVPQHSKVQGMGLGKNADAHHRCYKRDIVLLTELADTLLAVSEDNTAAGTDQRLFRFIDRSDHFMHLWVISLCTWLVSADIDLGRVVEGLL